MRRNTIFVLLYSWLLAEFTLPLQAKQPEEILKEKNVVYEPVGYYLCVYMLLLWLLSLFLSFRKKAEYSCFPFEFVLEHSAIMNVCLLDVSIPVEIKYTPIYRIR